MYQNEDQQELLLEAGVHKQPPRQCRKACFRSRTIRVSLVSLVLAASTAGLLYVAGALISGLSLQPWVSEKFLDWDISSIRGNASTTFPTTITHNVKPLQCHSHNDYWRRVPLYEALHYGCASVEADVWRMDMTGSGEYDLYIGHSLPSLLPKRTLRKLYIDPLVRMLDARNKNSTSGAFDGVFEGAPTQALVLLVDLKNDPHLAFDILSTQLEPLRSRGYLTYHNGTSLVPGPLTIATTGSTPYTSVLAQNSTHRDIFFDAPLGDLTSTPATTNPANTKAIPHHFSGYNTTTSLYASNSLRRILNHPVPFLFPGRPSQSQLERIRSATSAAHAQGLKVRWWDTPDWPRSRRERVWRILMEEGADVLNVDDLKAARDWEGW